MYVYSDTKANLLYVETVDACKCFDIQSQDGSRVECPILYSRQIVGGYRTALDAANLLPWNLEKPILYQISAGGETIRFGHTSLRTFQASTVLLNETPVYLRGYIRGIVAHDHPNMTGQSDYDAARKNILQAKKYGFNLVRFHSTVPTEDFVRAADELGLLIHMEIGYQYEINADGTKRVSTNNSTWVDTILKYRNHPSVAIFCIGNEMHNAGHFQEVQALYEEGKRLAPTKLIMDNAGWGEYDRTSADIFSQHIAYYFPYKQHRDMFVSDDAWLINGSVSDEPLNCETHNSAFTSVVHRHAIPVCPTLSHEAVHYIDIPDYGALCRKYEEFASRVGEEYMKAHHIKKPRFMTELPELIERKHLQPYMADYCAGSQRFRQMATKIFLERLRLSKLCGFEMLQFSDCFKYENKNGIVDCFDDDKNIEATTFRQSNDDLVLLKDQDKETYFEDEAVDFTIYVSDFDSNPELCGDLIVYADGVPAFVGKSYVLVGDLQKLASVHMTFAARGEACRHEIRAVFTYRGKIAENSWSIWTYPHKKPVCCPECGSLTPELMSFMQSGTQRSELYVTDSFDESVFLKLAEGKTALLLYRYGAEQNKWQMPGAIERFKPCIWDRGSNLGGFVRDEGLCSALAVDRYFDLNLQKLLEAGSKVNLDHFPCAVNEIFCGIDKPVRDRMQGLVTGNKNFVDDGMLRRFSHLFSFKVGSGKLLVCTLNVDTPSDPVVQNFLSAVVDRADQFADGFGIDADVFRKWLDEVNDAGFTPEDIMNRFWEQDNKPVEDVLFWEDAGINLADII